MHRSRKRAGRDHGNGAQLRQFTKDFDAILHRLEAGSYRIKEYLGEDSISLCTIKGETVLHLKVDNILTAKIADAVIFAGQLQENFCCICNHPVKIKAEKSRIDFCLCQIIFSAFSETLAGFLH